MGLKALDIPPSLDTSHHEIAKQFYIPALKKSVYYDRAVGFFTSDWIRINAEGMAEFVMNGGKARWIISPILSHEDAKALEEGYEAKHNKVLFDSLERSICELETNLEEETRSTMAWLISDGVLEFRIALPCSKLSGDFHVKFGIFSDEEGNIISFDGSQNETAKGFRNYESIKIFWNWDLSLTVYVDSDIHRFKRLWHDRDLNVRTHTIPEAVRHKLLQLRTLPCPYARGEAFGGSTSRKREEVPYSRPLWPHQEEAVEAWEKAGRKGIVIMATGSGKTRTAVTAVSQVPDLKIFIVAVPSRELVNQWTDDLKSLGLPRLPLKITGSFREWKEQAYRLLTLLKVKQIEVPIALIGTYASLSGEQFQSLLHRIGLPPKGALLIADEVHNAGAPRNGRILNQGFEFRLGLTATLERELDPDGTQLVKGYFHGVVFEFDMEKAIQNGVLCPYKYFPLFAILNDQELQEYDELTRRIVQLIGMDLPEEGEGGWNGTPDNELDQLYIRRAKILKKCANKINIFEELLEKKILTKALIYCADHEQVDQLEKVLRSKRVSWLRFSGKENADTRKRALDLLSSGNIQTLVSINCLDEGVDIPSVQSAVLIASSGNPRQFVQRRGRILRKHPGKRHAILFDILAIPPSQGSYYDSPLLKSELKRATIMARSAMNAKTAQAELFGALESLGVGAIEVL